MPTDTQLHNMEAEGNSWEFDSIGYKGFNEP